METLEKMLARHERERLDFINKQDRTWQDLRKEFGDPIPWPVYFEWDKRYGNIPLNALSAEHAAEREAHPEDPKSYGVVEQTDLERQAEIDEMLSEDNYQKYLEEQSKKAAKQTEIEQVSNDTFEELLKIFIKKQLDQTDGHPEI